MRPADPTLLDIPDFCLVVLIGATGSGKSSFAARWFKPTEVISSDRCRGLACDDENDQSVSADAFELVAAIAGKRLKHRRLAVIDATNVRPADRKAWVELARRWHALPVAVVLDPGLDVCIERNKARPDRDFDPGVPQRMIQEIRRGLRGLDKEGFRQIWKLNSVLTIEAARIERRPMWTDRRNDHGPFDVIGDVHGCADELRALLDRLGYVVSGEGDALTVVAPHGRKLVFVGDLVDRGPNTPEVLRIAIAAQAAGVGETVQGNHDRKLSRWLEGRKVAVTHGLQDSIDQLAGEPPEFLARVKRFLGNLRSHYWLDGGKLAVVHAGLKEEMIGRGSPAVRDFALFGETTGETDEFGLPVRLDWAANYRGKTTVVYGHTPTPEAEWVNDTICIDTGCVFGGKLTALCWPERELVSLPAARTYSEPVRPLQPTPEARAGQAQADDMLDAADVLGRRWIDVGLLRRIPIAEENAAAALEAMSRFAIAPQWLIYLPPTMSPVETSAQEGFLERPEEAFAFYRERGNHEVVLQEKHMGSRACLAVCRDADAARRRFGVISGESGAIWTRTGRAFFPMRRDAEALLALLRAACDSAGLWKELNTDWLLFDAEIMPWSAKASALIEQQYAPVAAASGAGLALAHEAAARAAARGVPVEAWRDRLAARAEAAAWWEALTASGGEGIVVKPRDFIPRGAKGLIQPALKVRGREYLRIIYGPEYDLPDNLTRLRERGLGGKRANALREFALGHEALSRFVARAPLRKTHECVFAILALESEPIDPRL